MADNKKGQSETVNAAPPGGTLPTSPNRAAYRRTLGTCVEESLKDNVENEAPDRHIVTGHVDVSRNDDGSLVANGKSTPNSGIPFYRIHAEVINNGATGPDQLVISTVDPVHALFPNDPTMLTVPDTRNLGQYTVTEGTGLHASPAKKAEQIKAREEKIVKDAAVCMKRNGYNPTM